MSDLAAVRHQVSAAWLRQRFADGFTETPELPHDEEALTDAQRDGLVPAAVLVPVVQREPELTVLFTQRTAHLHDHPGQIAFPGGRSEAHDGSPVVTALREVEEEIGLPRERVDVLGTLPEYCTITGFRVTPVVGLVDPAARAETRQLRGGRRIRSAAFLLARCAQPSAPVTGVRRRLAPVLGDDVRRLPYLGCDRRNGGEPTALPVRRILSALFGAARRPRAMRSTDRIVLSSPLSFRRSDSFGSRAGPFE